MGLIDAAKYLKQRELSFYRSVWVQRLSKRESRQECVLVELSRVASYLKEVKRGEPNYPERVYGCDIV